MYTYSLIQWQWGWGEGLVPSNCRALLKSPLPDPLPTSSSWGEGIDRGLGGCIKTRPPFAPRPGNRLASECESSKHSLFFDHEVQVFFTRNSGRIQFVGPTRRRGRRNSDAARAQGIDPAGAAVAAGTGAQIIQSSTGMPHRTGRLRAAGS